MTLLKSMLMVIAAGHLLSVATETTLAVPGRVNSTPWIAASGADVVVAWGAAADGKGDVFVVSSKDGGRTFGQPVRVNSVVGEARINGEIAPRVALSTRARSAPMVTVTWNAKGASTEIKSARSRDGGRTFVEESNLQEAGAAGDRGWQASVLDGSGKLHTIWLDHRAMAQGSALYYAADGMPERELFKGVCYCCKTAMAIGPKGELYAAWRHVFAGNMRDMAFTVSRDSGRTFSPLTRVNQDGWSIAGCPDDGPAMAVDANGTVHLVWPTVRNEQGVILYSTSQDGRTFSPPVSLPTLGGPKPSHPQIAINASGRILVAWDEVSSGVRRAAIKPIGGADPPELLGASTSYPVMAAVEGGVIAAWTSGPANQSVIKVKRIE